MKATNNESVLQVSNQALSLFKAHFLISCSFLTSWTGSHHHRWQAHPKIQQAEPMDSHEPEALARTGGYYCGKPVTKLSKELQHSTPRTKLPTEPKNPVSPSPTLPILPPHSRSYSNTSSDGTGDRRSSHPLTLCTPPFFATLLF